MSGLDPSERAHKKQASRDRDDKRLANGEVSREALRKEVGLFSGLDLARSTVKRRLGRAP
jgi:hypothetical protein